MIPIGKLLQTIRPDANITAVRINDFVKNKTIDRYVLSHFIKLQEVYWKERLLRALKCYLLS